MTQLWSICEVLISNLDTTLKMDGYNFFYLFCVFLLGEGGNGGRHKSQEGLHIAVIGVVSKCFYFLYFLSFISSFLCFMFFFLCFYFVGGGSKMYRVQNMLGIARFHGNGVYTSYPKLTNMDEKHVNGGY